MARSPAGVEVRAVGTRAARGLCATRRRRLPAQGLTDHGKLACQPDICVTKYVETLTADLPDTAQHACAVSHEGAVTC